MRGVEQQMLIARRHYSADTVRQRSQPDYLPELQDSPGSIVFRASGPVTSVTGVATASAGRLPDACYWAGGTTATVTVFSTVWIAWPARITSARPV